jgi:hypothetical protein
LPRPGRGDSMRPVIDFLFLLPLWLLAVMLNLWLMGFALLSLWVTRRWVTSRLRIAGDDALFFGAASLQSAMVLYGLVTALTAFSVWGRYEQVSGVVSSEATAIASLWRDLGGYPQPQRDTTRDLLRGYTDQVIRGAWPTQQQGRIPTEGVEWLDRLQAQLFAYEPASESQKILHAEVLGAYNRTVQVRRQRLDAVQTGLPVVMWFVLLPGAMGCLLLFALYRVEDVRYQALMMCAMAGFVAMVLFVIITLDRPFRGPMAVGPDSYQLIYDQLMRK